ncbi:ATP-binding protein [Anaerobacillus sp. 1_MG-2023]|uniref:ATP-binding protein n=1 Tax=Anaerobacillus sp. 1_MG-2023 TaxID=3062655 RepID=UPI0026E3092E|nr:ATP-binding protein [Anaerobacillus sp. 1_MG-2023]MDO6657866.1 ATP-binding protein [Anaerobacillus sp. 1_MG-2023]
MNLISLIDAKNNLKKEVYKEYKIINGVNIRDYEVQCIASLVRNLYENTSGNYDLVKYLDQFSVGYEIKQIGKEFDLLRLGENYNINIELKSEFTSSDKIKNQLIKNAYYLSPLKKKAYLITFIEDENRFVCLHNDTLIDIEVKEVLNLIYEQNVNIRENLDVYFDPSYYLVSPFNSTNEFINGEYFLTAQQENIKKELMESYINKPYRVSIKGAPGTGKTLLIYDIAKEQRLQGKKVLIIHCGMLNSGHNKLIDKFNWAICGIRNFRSNISSDLDLVIIDESQRIDLTKFNALLELTDNMNITCIFSHDGAQCLHSKEINRQMATKIIDSCDVTYSLKEKVRTNKEMATFIKHLFNLNTAESNNKYNFEDIVHMRYFENMQTAKEYSVVLRRDGWKFINFTNSLHNIDPFDDSIIHGIEENAHKVVGQEFEKVGVIIDQHFYYENGRLMGTNQSYYHSTKMLFQILTRAKKKLCLILVNNEDMLSNVLLFLNDGSGKHSIPS